MKTLLDCVPCFTRQALDAVNLATPDRLQRQSGLRELLYDIAEADWDGTPPAMGQRIHRIIRRELACEDPYRGIKDRMNQTAASLVPIMRKRIESHPRPAEAAVRVAIGGNLLDVGAKTQITADALPDHLDSIWSPPLHGNLNRFFQAVEQADSILYLADNAGEIYFDRLLIERLPVEKITVFVRGFPVLNDATREDAEAAGLTTIVPVRDNGSDAPGTILADCSGEFRRAFAHAGLIIAKGQGNFETLSDANRNIMFLFTVKCPLVAAHVGKPVGSLMVTSRHEFNRPKA